MSNFNGQFFGQPNYDPYNTMNNHLNGYRNYMDMNPYQRNVPTQPIQPAQNQQMNIQPQSNNMQFVLVPSIEVAQNATAEKGQTIYMMNQNKPEIYAKAADGFGLQTTKYFRLFEFDPAAEAQMQNNPAQNGAYVTRDEFNKLAAAVSAELEAIKQAPSMTTMESSAAQVQKQVSPSNNKKSPTKEAENKE